MATLASRKEQVRPRLGADDVAGADDRGAVRPGDPRPRPRRAAIAAVDVFGAHTALMHAQEIIDELYTSLDVKQWPAARSC